MHGRTTTLSLGFALSVVAFCSTRGQETWRDPAPHTVRFIQVARGIQLHTLDFGGSGPPLLMLAGLGNTAHAFDDFAPAFTDRFHVIAITRRGFGESSHPRSGYDVPTLVHDIVAVLDSLQFDRVVVIGHSIASEEMTRLAADYPQRVDKLVYLDGAYDRVRAGQLLDAHAVPAPKGEVVIAPRGLDTTSAPAYVAYVHKSRGVNIPEADIRTRYQYDGWREEATPAYKAVGIERPPYGRVRAPALSIYAVDDRSDELYSLLRSEFKREVSHAQVLELHGAHHWIFVSHRAQVIAAIRAFLSA